MEIKPGDPTNCPAPHCTKCQHIELCKRKLDEKLGITGNINIAQAALERSERRRQQDSTTGR
ncbi:hypothetical protein KKC08_03435 [Patescibacteria group bacterium]|nr:hypothetical protein [Patescibacteria group bacterium]MCG2701984.1 hypothetical protein [Candidatus Parcubacteria bacterium]MBU4265327.1 hypothetical protein [Patescibacteria group bacterium]MBU4389901.1 hypothetical protein [Patescibacteria group bacterium]MBU4397192.1 hypothetical protein [Patescibacteria group bacterium]